MSVGLAVSRNSLKSICFDSLERIFALDALERENYRSALVSEMTTGADILGRCFIRSCEAERCSLPDQAGIDLTRGLLTLRHEALV